MQAHYQRQRLDLRKGFSRFLLTGNLHLLIRLAHFADNKRHRDWCEVVGIDKSSKPRIDPKPAVQPTHGPAPRHVREVYHRQLRLVISPDFKRLVRHSENRVIREIRVLSSSSATPHGLRRPSSCRRTAATVGRWPRRAPGPRPAACPVGSSASASVGRRFPWIA